MAQIIYDIGFRADTSSLQQQIAALNSDINRAFELRNRGELGDEIQKGVAAASTLKSVLQQATTDKGLSFVAMNTALQKAGTSAAQLVKDLQSSGMHASVNAFVEAFTTADRTILSMTAKIAEMGRVLKQSAKFTIAQEALQFTQKVFDSGIQWSKDMNAVLNDIAIVSEKTGSSLDATFEKIVEGAHELGIAAKEYGEASLIFYQQGLADDEVAARTETTIKAAKAAGESVTAMSEELTAVWNTYQMQGEQLENAASIGARLGAETAVDFAYIAEAMQISASAASQMGVSYESLSAIIATVGETTLQSASIVGNAYKTIFSRFYNLKSAGEEGEVELGRIAKQLDEMGISIMDLSGELIPLDQIIQDIGNSWDTYTQKQQIAIAETVGGTRQYGQFLALMNNFDKYQKNLSSAKSEQGSETLDRQYDVYQQSAEAAQARAEEAWARTMGEVFNEDAIIKFYEILEDVGNIVGGITEGLGGLEGILKYLSAVMITKMVPTFRNMVISAKELKANLSVEGRIEHANKQYDQMAKKIENVASAQAKITSKGTLQVSTPAAPVATGSVDNSALSAKVQMARELTSLQIRLQEVQAKGNMAEQQMASSYAEALAAKQKEYNVTVDTVNQLKRQLQTQQELNKARAPQTNSTQNSMQGNMLKAVEATRKSVLANKGDVDTKGAQETAARIKLMAAEVGKAAKSMDADSRRLAVEFGKALSKISKDAAKGGTATTQALENMASAVETYSQQVADTPGTTSLFDNAEGVQQTTAMVQEASRQISSLQGQATELRDISTQADGFLANTQVQVMDLGQSLSNAAGSLVGFLTSFENFTTMLAEGDFTMTEFLTSSLMLGTTIGSLFGTVKPLIAAYKQLVAIQKAVNIANTAGITIDQAKAAITALNIDAETKQALMTKLLTKNRQVGAQAALQQTLTEAGLTTAVEGNTAAVAANTATWLTNPIFLVIAAAVASVIAVFAMWNSILKANREAAKATAEATAETAQKQRELTEEIKANTSAVEENEAAYKKAVNTGEDAQEEYEALADSLSQLTLSLVKAGGEQEKLNTLMQQGLATGDLTDYYKEAEKIQEQQQKDMIASQMGAMKAQLGATKAEMAKWYDLSGSRTLEMDSIDAEGYLEFSDTLQDIIDKYEVIEAGGKIQMDFSDPAKFREQFEELIQAKTDLEKSMTADQLSSNAAYKSLTKTIGELQSTYDSLQQSVDTTSAAVSSMYEGAITDLSAAVEGMDFSSAVNAMGAVANSIKETGLAAGMTETEVMSLINTLMSSDEALNRVMVMAEKATTIRKAIVSNAGLAYSNQTEVSAARDHLEEQRNFDPGAVDIGQWGNGLSQTSEVQLDRIKEATGQDFESMLMKDFKRDEREEEAKKIIKEYYDGIEETINEEAQKLSNLENGINDFMSNLNSEEVDLLVHINYDNIASIDDLEDKLEALKEVELTVKVNYEDQLASANETQANLKDAIDEYQEGPLSYDTVGELLALGPEYKRFIVETAEGYALSTEAIEAYNQSIRDEKEALDGLLNRQTDFSLPFEDLAYAAADLSAMPEWLSNGSIEQAAGTIADLTEKFYNADISKEEFFSGTADGGEGGLIGQLKQIGDISSTLNVDQLREISPMLAQVSESLVDFFEDTKAAYQAGEMDGGDYAGQLNILKETAFELNKVKTSNLTKQLEDTGIAISDLTIDADGMIQVTKDMSDEQKDLVKELNNTTKASKTLDKAIKSSEISENILGIASEYHDKLAEVFDAETLELNPDIEVDYTWMDEMTSKISENFRALDAETQAQLTSMIASASQKIAKVQGLTADEQSIVAQVAQSMLTTGASFEQALNATGQAFALDQEQINTIHSAATAAIIQTGTDAANQGMNETLGIMKQGEEEAAKFGVKIGVKEVGIKGTFPVKFNILGKDFSFNLPKPYLELEATASGALGTIMNNAAGANLGSSDIPAYTPISGLGGTLPTLDAPTAGDPNAILDDDEGGGKKDSSGGGGGDFSPEDLVDEDDIEKFHERYEDLTEQIERITSVMEDWSSAADDAYGAAKLRALAQYEREMQKFAAKQKALIKETQDYLAEDKKALTANAGVKAIAQFDSFGNLTNPEAIRKHWEAMAKVAAEEYNAAVIKYNNAKSTSDTAKAALDAAKTTYEATKEQIQKEIEKLDQFLETEDLLRERINEQVENIREWMTNKVEMASIKMELQISISETDIEWMDFILDKWGDTGIKTGKAWNGLKDNLASSADSLSAMIDNSNRMYEILNNIDPSKTDGTWFKNKFGEEAWNKYLQGNGTLPEEVISQLEDDVSSMIDQLDSMYDIAEEMLGQYVEILNLYMDEFDKIADQISNQNDLLEMYGDLLEFSGQKYTGKGREATKNLMDASMSNAKTEVLRAKAQLEVAEQAAEESRGQLQAFYDDYGEDPSGWTDAEAFIHEQLQNTVSEAEDALNDAQSTFTGSIQDLADAASEAIEQMAESIKYEVIENLGGDFAEFSSMTDMYDKQKDLDSFFLEGYDKTYQLNKLLGEINDQMENITDPARLAEYNALIAETNALNQEGVDVTQKDVDLLNAKFAIQQAQDAYEEAKNAQNTMRLARDASGNWNYVYSSDQTQTEDAAQNLANAQYNYDKLLHEARDESEQLWMQAQQEFFEFQETIDWARYAADEKYKAEIDSMQEYYLQKTQLYSGEVIKYNNLLGENFADTTLGVITNYTSMEQAQADYTIEHKNYHTLLEQNTQHYSDIVEEVCDSVGIDYHNLTGTIENETAEMINGNNRLSQNITTLKNKAKADLSEMNRNISSWRASFVNDMNAAMAAVDAMIQKLQQLRAAQLEESSVTGYDKNTDYTDYLHTDYAAFKAAGGEDDMATWLDKYHKTDVLERINAGDDRGIYAGVNYEEAKQIIVDAFKEGAEYINGNQYNYGEGESGKTLNDWDTILATGQRADGGLVDKPGFYQLAEDGEPEYVLNPEDTKNILAAVRLAQQQVKYQLDIKQYADLLNQTQKSSEASLWAQIRPETTTTPVAQDVKIEATFPNVSVASEIEEAFNNLVNQAVQYVGKANKK